MNPVKTLQEHGQAVWLDFLARGFIANGDLKKLVDEDGLRGVTSNPSIFEKAIDGSDEYDDEIKRTLQQGDRPVGDLYERLAVEDIKHAADVLRPVYDAAGGARRLREHRGLSLSGDGNRRHNRRGEAAVARSRSREPDDQGAGDEGRFARHPRAYCRRRQRQYHAAVLAGRLRKGCRGLHLRP